MGKCAHKRWRHAWAIWAATFALTGIVGDTVAYVRHGWEATLTAAIRRWAGIEPRTAWGRLGLTALLAFFTWCGVHLGFGALGPTQGRPAVVQHFHNSAYRGERE